MSLKKKQELPDTRLRLENFYKRWNIELSDDDRWLKFKNIVLNGYLDKIGLEILRNKKVKMNFLL